MTGTQTVDLAAWLTAIWDEEERLAKRVADRYVTPAGQVYWPRPRVEAAFGQGDDPDILAGLDLIKRNDPASVLARIAADRKILELHKIEVRKIDHPPFDELTGERWPDQYDVICRVCGWAAEDPSSACETVRLLASPYKGREGWQEEWDE